MTHNIVSEKLHS